MSTEKTRILPLYLEWAHFVHRMLKLQVKVKLFLRLTKQYAFKAYDRVDV
jgi:hypothetical protein